MLRTRPLIAVTLRYFGCGCGLSTLWGICAGLLVILPAGTATAVAGGERLEDYLKGLRTLSSRFEQTTLSADGGRMAKSRGTMYLKRPGKFRWEYDSPVKQVISRRRQACLAARPGAGSGLPPGPEKALSGTPPSSLPPRSPSTATSEVSPWDGGDEREWVELQPKKADTQVVRIRIGFIGKRLDTLLMEDSFGQLTRISFTGTKRNPSLKEGLFRLKQSTGGDFLQLD